MTKKNSLFLLLSLIVTCHCLSQNINELDKQSINNNYREFRRFFEEEIEKTRQRIDDTPYPSILAIPETLPYWLTDISRTNSDSIFLLGISDPGMDSIAGMRMARQRAILIYLLSNELHLINMRDLFSTDDGAQFGQTFIEYSEIAVDYQPKALVPEIINTHITKFGETIVKIGLPVSKNDHEHPGEQSYQLSASLFTQFKRHGNKMHTDEKLHLAMFIYDEDKPVHLDHHYIKINQVTNARTYENDILISDLSALRLQYKDLPSNDSFLNECNDKQYDTGISMHNGLWHALISGYLHVLADGCQEGSMHFSTVSDYYNQLNLSLSREFANCRLQAGIPAFQVVDNKLFLIFKTKTD